MADGAMVATKTDSVLYLFDRAESRHVLRQRLLGKSVRRLSGVRGAGQRRHHRSAPRGHSGASHLPDRRSQSMQRPLEKTPEAGRFSGAGRMKIPPFTPR